MHMHYLLERVEGEVGQLHGMFVQYARPVVGVGGWVRKERGIGRMKRFAAHDIFKSCFVSGLLVH